MEPQYFRLRPYVFLVKGSASDALYDLHNRRIFPIPSSAGYVLEQCAAGTVDQMLQGIGDVEDRRTAQEYLDELAAMDFGRYHDDLSTLISFRAEYPEHKRRQLLWLSIDVRAEHDAAPDWLDLLHIARRDHGCRQLTVFVGGTEAAQEEEIAVVEAGAAMGFDHIEVVMPGAFVSDRWEAAARQHGVRIALMAEADPHHATYTRLQESQVHVRFGRTTPATMTRRMLICDHDSFSRLRNVSVHCNSLHINSRGDVFPWALETEHLIGTVTDGASLTRVMSSAELRRVWSFTKDSVEQCSECELRYACPNSYTFRRDPAVVGSAPVNCDYDPRTGAWRNETEGDRFDEAGLAAAIRRTNDHFEVFSTPQRPMPTSYLDVLDAIVERAAAELGIPRPAARLRYLYYPAVSELTAEGSSLRGLHLSGVTQSSADGGLIIRSAYPAHAHEVLHALFAAVNPEPRFFVSEACATLFGGCWGTEEDLCAPPSFSLEDDELRVIDAGGRAVAVERCLLYDDKGLLIGPLRGQSVHAIARQLIVEDGVKPHLRSWFDAADESVVPGYFYFLGGSFFLWLIETRGPARFLEFYATKQTLRHFEGYYESDIASLTSQWTAFLGAAVR